MVSVKIGGGTNLHNVDAFIVFVLLIGSYVYFGCFAADREQAEPIGLLQPHPVLSAWVVLAPVMYALSQGGPIETPDYLAAEQTIETLREYAEMAEAEGKEVLFISQRHLVTFNTLGEVMLVHDYEKLYLMEMVMANYQPYLENLYDDLREQRYAAIVTDPLFERIKDPEDEAAAEENNLFIRRVTRPLLCYYEPPSPSRKRWSRCWSRWMSLFVNHRQLIVTALPFAALGINICHSLNEKYAVMEISVFIPVYNEAGSLPELYAQLSVVLAPWKRNYEILFVDDGSTDGSYEVLAKLHTQDKRVKVIQFRKNYGKSAALAVGFDAAEGDIFIMMDADLQDDPNEIPKFLDKLEEGFDFVNGWKYPRLDPLNKTLPSRLFNFTMRSAMRIDIHDFNCGFKAMRRGVAEEITLYGELHRQIPVLAARRGFKVTEVKVKHHPRRFGESKFGFQRYYRGLFDFVTVYFLTEYTPPPAALLRRFWHPGIQRWYDH